MPSTSLALHGEPDDVPRARHFTAGVLGEHELTAEAQLVVTELTTNALIHGLLPVTVSVDATDVVRIEVYDASPVGPLRSIASLDSMTGRGMALVTALSRRWGVDARGDGKVVWAELDSTHTTLADVDIDAAIAAWPDLDDVPGAEPRYTVSLGDVPTWLLLEAKAHVDNVVREFTLARSGAESGATAQVPPQLARLIDTVTHRFTEARRAIKRQALVAAAAGEERTRLTLTLPLSAAQAGREYLAGLDEADSYARAARLLTLESPPQHHAFRHWYVTALAEQLDAIAAGVEPGTPEPFETFLLDELAVVVSAQRIADRAARLQTVTSSLARAATTQEVGQVVVSEGVTALEASGGALLLGAGENRLDVPAIVGYRDETAELLRTESPDAQLPAAHALRTGEALWIESREVRDRLFPELRGLEPATVSLCAVPLVAPDRVIGALRFSFDSPRLFDEDERRFVRALAAQTAQAVERSELYQAEQAARLDAETSARRLTRLHQVTAALAAASTEEEVAETVALEAAQSLGSNLSALCVLKDPETLTIIGLHGASTTTRERWNDFPVAADLPASIAVRENRPVVEHSRSAIEGRFPALEGEIPREGSLACVPIAIGDRVLGALSLSFPPEHVIDDAEVELLVTIGRQCALALERTQLLAAERKARDVASFLADATALLTSSLEPEETLDNLASLLVPALGDWGLVYLADARGDVRAATAVHRDATVTEFLRAGQRGRPLDMSSPSGISEVLQNGVTVRFEEVPEALRQRIVSQIEDPDLLAALLPQSAIVVPLLSRGTTLGLVIVVRTHGEAFTLDEQQLVEEVAARAAVAVDNAEQFRRERDAALTLQRSLLPQRLPAIPGVSFAWRYLPGAAGTHIGGDWYDVLPLDETRVALVIGDVMGRGLRAAAVMGQLRATARAHATRMAGPAEVLTALDTAVARLEQDQITTTLFAILDLTDHTLTLASAGHLPPLLATAHGAEFLDVEPGPPLGAGGTGYPESKVVLPAGSTLLLYTDGLVEDRVLSVDTGMAKLRRAVTGAPTPEAMCDLALAALGRDREHDDDTAVLAVTLAP